MTARHIPDGQIVRLADGSTDGEHPALPIGTRVVATYPWHHTRENVTETRHGFGRVTRVYANGRVAVDTDRDGLVIVGVEDMEVVA